MYVLNDEQIAALDIFGAKLPDSTVRANIEKWVSEIPESGRVTSEQMERFVGFGTHLPKEFADYPQSFAMWVKNGEAAQVREKAEKVKEPVNFVKEVNEPLAIIPDAPKAPDETPAPEKDQKKEAPTKREGKK